MDGDLESMMGIYNGRWDLEWMMGFRMDDGI